MAIESRTETMMVSATSRLRLPSERQKKLDSYMAAANKYGLRIVNIVDGPVQPFGPLGNVIQYCTLIYEIDTEDPRCQEFLRLEEEDKKANASRSSNSKGGCYVATAVYGSYNCPEVWTLRRFRDYTLAGTWYGRAFIRIYYSISPSLVKFFGKTGWFKRLLQPKLDRMVKKLNSNGIPDAPYDDRKW